MILLNSILLKQMQTHSLQMKMIILYLHEVGQKLLILRHSLRAFVKHGNISYIDVLSN